MVPDAEREHHREAAVSEVQAFTRHLLEPSGMMLAAVRNVLRVRIDTDVIAPRQHETAAAAAEIEDGPWSEPGLFAPQDRVQRIRLVPRGQCICAREDFLNEVERETCLHLAEARSAGAAFPGA